MIISKKVEKAINRQLNRELYSEYLYLGMAAYFEANNFKGAAKWMKVQVKEEFSHAMKYYKYVYDRGGKVILEDIEAPPSEWKSMLDAFKHVYEHEKKVTEMINNLLKTAKEEKDSATEIFLQWFITEQVEEEASALEIVDKLQLLEKVPGGEFIVDRELGRRE